MGGSRCDWTRGGTGREDLDDAGEESTWEVGCVRQGKGWRYNYVLVSLNIDVNLCMMVSVCETVII